MIYWCKCGCFLNLIINLKNSKFSLQNLKLSLARCHSVTLIHGNKLSIKICLNVRESDRKCFFTCFRTYKTTFRKNPSQKNVREKSRECHNYKPQPFPELKRKRKLTNPNKNKSNKRSKITKISSLFPKRGNRNAKRTEKHKNKMTKGKT